jgi:hypothetical protein
MPKKFPLTFEETEKGIVVSGKTFDYKDRIKQLGGRWNAEDKTWLIPSGTDLAPLHEPLPIASLLPPPAPPALPSWVCCDKATILSYPRQQHWCTAHGDPNQSSFFIHGRLYTGD